MAVGGEQLNLAEREHGPPIRFVIMGALPCGRQYHRDLVGAAFSPNPLTAERALRVP